MAGDWCYCQSSEIINSHIYGVTHLPNCSPLRRHTFCECPLRGAHDIPYYLSSDLYCINCQIKILIVFVWHIIRKEILGWGQERIFNVAMNVNNYHTIVDCLNAMAVASKELTETLYLPTLLITIQLTMHYLPLFNTN